jgi:hypothetical protein
MLIGEDPAGEAQPLNKQDAATAETAYCASVGQEAMVSLRSSYGARQNQFEDQRPVTVESKCRTEGTKAGID